MKCSYITNDGVDVLVVRGKIYLSYFFNNSSQIELNFISEKELKNELKINSLKALNLKDILSYYF
tara:strand:+ start:482 stop:676 length:195 start_codon:yes stop_codon:yes gene_type:complete